MPVPAFHSTVETLLQLDLVPFGEVILVDDSDDESLREWGADRPITYLRGPAENLPAARNVALDRCETAIISFVDDDVLLPADFSQRVADAFGDRPDVVGTGGPVLSPAVEDARNLCYRETMSVSTLTGTVHDASYRWVPERPRRVDLLKGANMSFRRAELEAIGGFDPSYGGPSQREETDVCVRLWSAGDLLYHPELSCFHKQLGSERFAPESVYWRFGNHGYFVAKNFGRVTFVLGLLSIVVRMCGNPDSLLQLLYRRLFLDQDVRIRACLASYVRTAAIE